ncbi:MAG: hypothetical protein IM669_06875 [Phenylobacterium sp.]|uniref:hypothetical protein n=1 Tax=Phenylobacterium sp. TaxID=1871053 RepID=UPI0025F1BE11|nr:hypothetical protein [Phenylobacterium sp.]MCA3757234.1 hypothetical protein [Phenylobacterium sp.]
MTDVLVELESLVPQMASGLEARRLHTSLGRASEKLVEVPRQARRFEALVDAALALGVASDVTASRSLREAAEEADEIGDLLEGAKSAEDLQYATQELPKLNQALTRLEGVVRQLWRQVVQTEFQSLVAVGDLLTRIERTRDLGERLAEVGRQAVGLAERNGPAEQLGPEIANLRQRRAALDLELHQLTDNPEVDEFLGAVTRDSATLRHVTPAVSEWLERSNALDAFAVRGSA